MGAVRAVFAWLGRRALLFALIVAALAAHRLIGSQVRSYGELRTVAAALGRESDALRGFSAAAAGRSDAALREARRLSRTALEVRIAAAEKARDDRAEACGGDLKALLRGGAEQVVANRRRCVEGSLHAREATALTALRDTADLRRPGETLGAAVRRQATTMRQAAMINAEKRRAARVLSTRAFGSVRFGSDIRRLTREADAARAAYDAAKGRAQALIAAQQRIDAATRQALVTAAAAQAGLDRLAADTREELGGNAVERARGWAERAGVDGLLRTAALAFVLIVATPYLLRLLFYWVLAPAAARRPAVRLRVGGAAIPPAALSTTSVGVTLRAGEELLVRQDYLQASAVEGTKRTQWLLDWRHPLTSIAAGLTFLTRINGAGALATVSAVRDPFAEVTVVTLPEGGACVLQPRALAAVVQPGRQPVRIESRWRVGSLHAWLTLQLRFLVFHGPARLVVKGGRGVRVEPAQRGRVFGQDQLVGFSADLAYSVTRTETFWPYFFGREPLLRDRVEDGDGMLIVEEAPMAGRRGGLGRGLEGAADAVLKVFGV
jgi:hypothetical protein